uniref:Odorant receptor n=1 Tax=Conogethes punctiferalis TaxID=1133088 RepID=A0A1X9PB43_CONPF|nr:odorant receptor 44 [Conogethes punctiferalis]
MLIILQHSYSTYLPTTFSCRSSHIPFVNLILYYLPPTYIIWIRTIDTIMYLKRPKMALTLIGLWFPPENHIIAYLIYRSFQLTIQYSFLIFNIIYMIMVWGDLEEVTIASYLLFTQATLCLKVTTFLVNKNRFSRLLKFLESDIFETQTEVEEKILSQQALKMWRLYSFFLACAMSNSSEWSAFPLMESGPREFPFKIWMPVSPSKSSNLEYAIGYGYQAFAIFSSATTLVTIDFITVSMIMFASAQLEIIASKIEMTKPVPMSAGLKLEDQDNLIRDNNNILKECIRQHQAVIRFVEMVENMFNVNIFFQMSGTVAIICVIAFRITIEDPNSMQFYSTLNYLVTMLAQLYLYCWCGNELTDRSQVLRDTLYKSPWYEQDQKFKKTLCIAMECMKRPIIFRAGYYIPLSRPTFVSILRCSYSYFAVLNQASDN